MTLAAQVNARIDPELKRSGDKGLAAAGISPTEGVRALYALASLYAKKPRKLIAALYPKAQEQAERSAADAKARKLKLIDEGASIVADTRAELGVSTSSSVVAPSFEDLIESAYDDKYGAFMGWHE